MQALAKVAAAARHGAMFLGAFLLFLAAPIAAAMALPRLGGSPEVLTTCVASLQIVFLIACLVERVLAHRLDPRWHAADLGLVLLAALPFLPLGLRASSRAFQGGWPAMRLLVILFDWVGLPAFAVAFTALRVLRSCREEGGAAGGRGHRVLVTGLAGSLVALLGYPILIEPVLRLSTPGFSFRPPVTLGPISQSTAWSLAYLALGILAIVGVVVSSRVRVVGPGTPPGSPAGGAGEGLDPGPPNLRTKLWWVALAFVASSLLLGTTRVLSARVATIPTLLVIPLAAYVVSFAVAFSARGVVIARWSGWVFAFLAVAIAVAQRMPGSMPIGILMVLDTLALLAAATALHGKIAEKAREGFVPWIAAGAALGGVLNAIVAPGVFGGFAEYPIALVLACLLGPAAFRPAAPASRSWRLALDVGLPVALAIVLLLSETAWSDGGAAGSARLFTVKLLLPAALCVASIPSPRRLAAALALMFVASSLGLNPAVRVLERERTFFGALRVARIESAESALAVKDGYWVYRTYASHALLRDGAECGSQILEPKLARTPGGHYHRSGPAGQVFDTLGAPGRLGRAAILGLGVAAPAAYGKPGQRITFYEIDPAAVALARDPRYFTYLGNSDATIDLVAKDGRTAIASEPDASLDLIVLAALACGPAPVHLATREAIVLYLDKLAPGGILAVDVTSDRLDLAPVFGAVCGDLGLACRVRDDHVESVEQVLEGKEDSSWIVVARRDADLEPLLSDARWVPLPRAAAPGGSARYLWTDDDASVLGLIGSRPAPRTYR